MGVEWEENKSLFSDHLYGPLFVSKLISGAYFTI